MWLRIDDIVVMLLFGASWVVLAGALLISIARHVLIRRRVEQEYRVRLARWRAAADSL